MAVVVEKLLLPWDKARIRMALLEGIFLAEKVSSNGMMNAYKYAHLISEMMGLPASSLNLIPVVQDMLHGRRASATKRIPRLDARCGEPCGTLSANLTSTTLPAVYAPQIVPEGWRTMESHAGGIIILPILQRLLSLVNLASN